MAIITGIFTPMRGNLSQPHQEARSRGYKPGRFSQRKRWDAVKPVQEMGRN